LPSLIRKVADRSKLEDAVELLSSHPSDQCSLLGMQIQSNLVIPERTGSNVLSGVLTTLGAQMQALLSPKITDISQRSDWTPLDLRRDKATLYITMTSAQVIEFAPLLRLILGIHLREYLAVLEEESKALPPILLMFDEMAQVGYIQAIEQAVDVGRSKGIKLWGFVQRFGHLEGSYSDARGLLGNCKVQTYLSPTTEDGTAQMVSGSLGTRQDLSTGGQTPLAEPAALAGAEFKEKTIVTGQGSHPAKVSRDYAYLNSEFQKLMRVPPPI